MPNWRDRAKPVASGGSWRDRAKPVSKFEGAPIQGDTTTAGMSALRGAADGASLGFADEIAGAAESLYDVATTDKSLKDLPDQYVKRRDESRAAYNKAREDNPKAFMAGQLGGGVATAFVPGLGALNAAKGAKAASVIGKGMLGGGISGLGTSEASALSNPEQVAKDIGVGAGLGGAAAGAFKGAGAVASGVKDKLKPSRVASVLLGAPEEAVELYSKNKQGVMSAPSRQDITREALDTIKNLQREVTDGSAASRKTLADEGVKIPGKELTSIFRDKADELLQRSEGVMDEQTQATYNWLRQQEKAYGSRQMVGPEVQKGAAAAELSMPGGASSGNKASGDVMMTLQGQGDPSFSTNRVKDLVQSIQNSTDYESAPGRFSRLDDRAKKEVGGKVNEVLKNTSPAYRGQMEGVANDTRLLDDVSSLAGSEQAMDNLLKRVQQDRAFFPAESIGKLDKRMKTNLLEKLKLSQAKEAFERGAKGPGGSRNVNLYEKMFGDIGEKTNLPFAKSIGAMTGATIDKRGPAIGKSIIDQSNKLQEILNDSQTVQRLGKFARPLMEAAKRGNKSLAVTHMLLMNNDPEYMNIVGDL